MFYVIRRLLLKGMRIMDKLLDEVKGYLKVLDEEIVVKEIEGLRASLKDCDNVNAQDIAKDILKKYGVNSEVIFKKDNFVKKKVKDLVGAFNHLLDIMGKNDLKSNLKIIFDILLLLVFISLCKIPFIVVRNLGESLLSYINLSYIYDIWDLVIEFVYIIVAVMIFINVFPKWFKNLKPGKIKENVSKEVKEPEKMGNDLESIVLTDDKK